MMNRDPFRHPGSRGRGFVCIGTFRGETRADPYGILDFRGHAAADAGSARAGALGSMVG